MMHVLKIAEIVTSNFDTLDLKSAIEQVVPVDRLDMFGLDPVELSTLAPAELAERLAERRPRAIEHAGNDQT